MVPVRFALVTTADASCVVTDDLSQLTGFGAGHRARTFRARRTGRLTGASVVLGLNSGGNAIAFEIWSVDQTNALQDFLAGTTVANFPATANPTLLPLTATFPAPAKVVIGMR